jgi:aryl-alcohol dehydrogenase-like predicted oxidoreductase
VIQLAAVTSPYVPFGRTGVRVSRLGLGTMSFGTDTDVATSAAMFARARDRGINLIDTADVYGKGRSEEIVGELIASCRDQIVLATKAYFPIGDGPNDRGSSAYHLVRAVEASLRRLRTDRIDVFYLHRFDDGTPLEESLRAVVLLVTGGKILYPAASNFAAWQVARALGYAELRGAARIAAIQPMYNLVKRTAEIELFPMALAEGIAVVPYGPTGGGLLSGKYGTSSRPPSSRLVENAMYAQRYGDPALFEVAERFNELAAAQGVHPVTLAVAWSMTHPAVTAPLIGGRNVEQIEPALAALEYSLHPSLRAAISALVPPPPPATDRNEEAGPNNYDAAVRARKPPLSTPPPSD